MKLPSLALPSFALLVLILLGGAAVSTEAAPVTLTGRFTYQDRLWDQDGYTGGTQDLPIRFADVEVVRQFSGEVLSIGSTDGDGGFSIAFDLGGSDDLYIRCLTSTDNDPSYFVSVWTGFIRSGGGVDTSPFDLHAITTETELVDPLSSSTWEFGEYLIEDLTGSGVAQAFNILDSGIDTFDYLATDAALGRYPTSDEYIVFGWNGTVGSTGSNYGSQGILITARPNDTDGWADTVVLHELGHWVSDLYGGDTSPGGPHLIGDNFQDPRLSYGEGYATFFCAEVREFRSPRLNDEGQPVDKEVSVYADLGVPPPPPQSGGLEFGYDFETGLYNTGSPIGQIGSASETGVTSVLWDLVDGPGTPDFTPGIDDDNLDESGEFSWNSTADYMPSRGQGDWLTLDDFNDGWFATNGSDFLRAEVDEIFTALNLTAMEVDAFEPDDDLATAVLVDPPTYQIQPGGNVVVSEVWVGDRDQVELFNSGEEPVDLTDWRLSAYRNTFPSSTYLFPPFVLYPGAHVVVHPGGSASDNNSRHLYGGPGFFVFWTGGADGAVTLRDPQNVGIDFLRWDGENPSTRNPPSGTTWTGSLAAAAPFESLARDENGTDTDDASDFVSTIFSMGMANFAPIPQHTIYPEGDVDLIRLTVSAGDVVSVNAYSGHSQGRPLLELLSEEGAPSGRESESFEIEGLASIQFIAPHDTTLYARVSNESTYNQYCPISLNVYKRPTGNGFDPPNSLTAQSENVSDLDDVMKVSWFNGAVYDSLEVYRDGVLQATIDGAATYYEEILFRGLYTYSVRGLVGVTPTASAMAKGFAGIVPCTTGDDFESGTSNLIRELNWGITPFSSEGTLALTDSPGSNYGNNQDVSVELIEPGELLLFPMLRFDHICLTEPEFDFGYVELSVDFGTTWTQLAAYDGDDDPGWLDGIADPEDWKSEEIDLSAYVGQKVRVRFRLVTDPGVVEDGWYIDAIRLSDENCDDPATTPSPQLSLDALQAWPNPFAEALTIQWSLAGEVEGRLEVIDVGGRRVRILREGTLSPAERVQWDGRDEFGQEVASGVYWLRLQTGEAGHVLRTLRLD